MKSGALEPESDFVGEDAVRRGSELSLPVYSGHGEGSPDDNPGLTRSDHGDQSKIGRAVHSLTQQNPDNVIRRLARVDCFPRSHDTFVGQGEVE